MSGPWSGPIGQALLRMVKLAQGPLPRRPNILASELKRQATADTEAQDGADPARQR